MQDRAREDRRRRSVLRALLVVGSSAAALGLAEAGVRAFGLSPRFEVVFRENLELSTNPVLAYGLAPGSSDAGFSISSAGLRDREFVLPKPEGVFRIAAIGDSIAFGSGCSQLEAFPKQLERLLDVSARGALRFEVLNFGVAGYNIAQIAERLRVQGLAYAPDLVLYAYSLNDPQSRNFEGQLSQAVREQLEGGSKGRGAARWLLHSRVFLLARHALLGDGPPPRVGTHVQADPEYTALRRNRAGEYFRSLHSEGEPARRFSQGMDELAQLARGAGVPVAVAIFPVFVPDGTAYPAADVHALVAAAAARRGFRALDLQSLYEAARAHFPEPISSDSMHPSCFGYRLAAAALLAWLDAQALLPEGSVDLARLAPGAEAWAAGAGRRLSRRRRGRRAGASAAPARACRSGRSGTRPRRPTPG